MNDQSRREFEAEMGATAIVSGRRTPFERSIDDDDKYLFDDVHYAWIAWQAARASAERVSGGDVVPDGRPLHARNPAADEPQFPAIGEDPDVRIYFYRVGWNQCRDAMLAAAPKVQSDTDGSRTPTSNPALATALYERIGDFRVYRDRDVVEVWDCGIGAWRRWGTVPEFEFNAPQTTGRGAPPEQPATVKECLTVGDALLQLPPDGAYIIRYDDTEAPDEFFAKTGARDAALCRYRQSSLAWNAHLYVKIDSNSRDAESYCPSAKYAPPATTEEPSAVGALTFDVLRDCNVRRQSEWCSNGVMPDLSYRSNELAGEVGEACNIVKKIERERLGWPGSRATIHDLGKELGDVVISIDLLASAAGINLAEYVTRSFNDKSAQMGHATFLPAIDNAATHPDARDAGLLALYREFYDTVADHFGCTHGVDAPRDGDPWWHETDAAYMTRDVVAAIETQDRARLDAKIEADEREHQEWWAKEKAGRAMGAKDGQS